MCSVSRKSARKIEYKQYIPVCVAHVSDRVIARKLEREQKTKIGRRGVGARGGGREKETLASSTSYLFFAPLLSSPTNLRGNACYAS